MPPQRFELKTRSKRRYNFTQQLGTPGSTPATCETIVLLIEVNLFKNQENYPSEHNKDNTVLQQSLK